MKYRRLPRLGWDISEVGYGMWGMGGWTGSDDAASATALDRAVALGCNFFDTAWAYGEGRSERLLGDLVRRHRSTALLTATKVPPKDRVWPGKGATPVDQVFPYDHIIEFTDRSLTNLGTDASSMSGTTVGRARLFASALSNRRPRHVRRARPRCRARGRVPVPQAGSPTPHLCAAAVRGR